MEDYKKYITKGIDFKPASKSKKLCVFAHFDTDSIIDDYVVEYLKEIKNCGYKIYFVSNCPNLGEVETGKLSKIVSKIILKENHGYDFSCYYTGYKVAEKELNELSDILFVNDSVYGPFYGLKDVFTKMSEKNLDVWGITDCINPHYYLQSYFLNFSINEQTIEALAGFFNNFEYLNNKDVIVERYESGLGKLLSYKGLKLGSLVSHEKVIGFENYNCEDNIVFELKESVLNFHNCKSNFFSNLKDLKRKKYVELKKFEVLFLGMPQYTSWYSMIEYFDWPFIKIAMLKNEGAMHFHNFIWRNVIERKYPDYDFSAVDKHLNRVRKIDIKKFKK